MYNRNEVQPPISLPDLSAWHLVPVGATVPAGLPYVYVYGDHLTVGLGGYPRAVTVEDNSYTLYTERPIALPLPTEEGATILAADDCRRPRILLTLEAGQWASSLGLQWNVEQIRAWCPVTLGETVVVRP